MYLGILEMYLAVLKMYRMVWYISKVLRYILEMYLGVFKMYREVWYISKVLYLNEMDDGAAGDFFKYPFSVYIFLLKNHSIFL